MSAIIELERSKNCFEDFSFFQVGYKNGSKKTVEISERGQFSYENILEIA